MCGNPSLTVGARIGYLHSSIADGIGAARVSKRFPVWAGASELRSGAQSGGFFHMKTAAGKRGTALLEVHLKRQVQDGQHQPRQQRDRHIERQVGRRRPLGHNPGIDHLQALPAKSDFASRLAQAHLHARQRSLLRLALRIQLIAMCLPRGQQFLAFRALPLQILYLLAHLHQARPRIAFLLAPIARVGGGFGALPDVGDLQFHALHLLLNLRPQIRRLLHRRLQAQQRLGRHRLGPTRVDLLQSLAQFGGLLLDAAQQILVAFRNRRAIDLHRGLRQEPGQRLRLCRFRQGNRDLHDARVTHQLHLEYAALERFDGPPRQSELPHRHLEKAVAVREMLVGFERFQVYRAHRHGGAQVRSRRRLHHQPRRRRILGRHHQARHRRQPRRQPGAGRDPTPAPAQVTDVTICVERFAHPRIPEIVYPDMLMIQAAAIMLIALILTPGLLFYFDVTPKLVVLLLASGVALVPMRRSKFMWLVMLTLASLALSTALSPNPALSFYGTRWRHCGLVTQSAVLVFAWALATQTHRIGADVVLRAVSAAGALTALYGIAQYLGWDPILPAAAYHIGEGIWTIVRPPSTLGYVSYFATWLLFVVFLSLALPGRLAKTCTALALIAMLLTGTRAAFLGLAAGAAVWIGMRIRPTHVPTPPALWPPAGFSAAALLALIFLYLSPAGQPLRSRSRWFAEDPWGGARPLLWRDSLRMGLARPMAGHGPETFRAVFPHYESAALARAYPDFAHESPHNIFLDALVGQGIAGPLLLAAWCALGFAAAWKIRGPHPDLAAGLDRKSTRL